MNVSDSERVRSGLTAENYEIVTDEALADVILFNTCSVREKAEHKLFTRVGQIRHDYKTKPAVGILGCVAQLEGETLFSKIEGVDFVVGTQAVGRIPAAIEKVFAGEKQHLDLGVREDDYDWSVSDAQRHSPYVGFLPITEGCNKFCTYCIVPFSRGRERSIPAAQILSHIEKLKNSGVSEVHLIGQNVNSYRPATNAGLENFSGATAFAKLLRAVAATGFERIKFTTSFPRDFHADIVEAINENDNLCNWVHLPVQSGSDSILRAMRRGHGREDYLRRVEKIRSSPRDLSLTTDIIVGFPGETDDDFQQTLDLVRSCEFDNAYVFEYSPRSGTPAAELGDLVPREIVKRRFAELDKLIQQLRLNSLQKLVGQTLKVLVEGFSVRHEENLSGHSTCHRVVNFSGTRELLGKIVSVKITEAKNNSLFGQIV